MLWWHVITYPSPNLQRVQLIVVIKAGSGKYLMKFSRNAHALSPSCTLCNTSNLNGNGIIMIWKNNHIMLIDFTFLGDIQQLVLSRQLKIDVHAIAHMTLFTPSSNWSDGSVVCERTLDCSGNIWKFTNSDEVKIRWSSFVCPTWRAGRNQTLFLWLVTRVLHCHWFRASDK